MILYAYKTERAWNAKNPTFENIVDLNSIKEFIDSYIN